MKLYLKAGLTIEAAYTVSLVLLILGVWIRLIFINHDRALANAVINEAMELYGHEDEKDMERLGLYADERLSGLLSQREADVSITEYRDGSRGRIAMSGYEGVLSDKGFEPQKIMRQLTLIEGIAGQIGGEAAKRPQ